MRVFFTDGACKGNPGSGGFGVISIENNEVKYKYSEQCEKTTNNREEIKAILHVFELAMKNYRFETVIIYSDSAYCVNMINNWIWNWANNNWINSKNKTVENVDLVKQLYKYLSTDFFPCQVIKVSGHAGECGNELADALATNNANKYKKILAENNITDINVELFEKTKKMLYN